MNTTTPTRTLPYINSSLTVERNLGDAKTSYISLWGGATVSMKLFGEAEVEIVERNDLFRWGDRIAIRHFQSRRCFRRKSVHRPEGKQDLLPAAGRRLLRRRGRLPLAGRPRARTRGPLQPVDGADGSYGRRPNSVMAPAFSIRTERMRPVRSTGPSKTTILSAGRAAGELQRGTVVALLAGRLAGPFDEDLDGADRRTVDCPPR